jgi:hypothetical protein
MDSEKDKYADRPLVWITQDTHHLKNDVQLKQATYDIHVINEGKRKELVGEENTLKAVVENPTYIWKDRNHNTRIHYGGIRRLMGNSKTRWINITVDTAENPPDVCTIISQSRPNNIDEEDLIYDSTKTDTF